MDIVKNGVQHPKISFSYFSNNPEIQKYKLFQRNRELELKVQISRKKSQLHI
jgi:hypothetical protein